MLKKVLFSVFLLQTFQSANLIPYYTDTDAAIHIKKYKSYHKNLLHYPRYMENHVLDDEGNSTTIRNRYFPKEDKEVLSNPYPKYKSSLYGVAYCVGDLFDEVKNELITKVGYDTNNLSNTQKRLIDFRWEKIQDYIESAIMCNIYSDNQNFKFENITKDFILNILENFSKYEEFEKYIPNYKTIHDYKIYNSIFH